MKNLDFLIIGAQKCATTTLFEHLRLHPDINMPLEKEVPFFTKATCTKERWRNFTKSHFEENDDRLWGKATPQYMCHDSVPERIHQLMPGLKLIAILRDPIERTWSHYQMGRRRGTEERSFDEAVDELLQAEAMTRGRSLPVPTHESGFESESDFYVAWSEYGRILRRYAQWFPPEKLLVLYTEDLQSKPEETLDRLLSFIGLTPGFRPETLGQVIHQGGASNFIPHSVRVWLRQRHLLYGLWQCLPEAKRGRLRFLYEQWNVRKLPLTKKQISVATRDALQKHYGEDLQALLKLPIEAPPWLQAYLQA
jgi:hypothetical protein